jgi:hypothetical protein
VRKLDQVTEGEWMLVTHAERSLGLSNGALRNWLQRRGLWKLRTRRRGKYRVIKLSTLEWYLAETDREGVERVSVRPPGTVSVYQAADIVGSSVHVVWKAAKRGHIRAARVGYVNWYDRADCERYRFEFHDHPLPGWVEIKATADAEGADPYTVVRWLQRHQFDVRKYRRPTDKQFVNYARAEALEQWLAYYRGAKATGSLAGQKLNRRQAREIRSRRAQGEKRCELAREYGVSEAAIYQILNQKTYREPQVEARAA